MVGRSAHILIMDDIVVPHPMSLQFAASIQHHLDRHLLHAIVGDLSALGRPVTRPPMMDAVPGLARSKHKD
jgi:hypothetical protein